MPSELDDAVIELCRLAESHRGDYDGWETQVISMHKAYGFQDWLWL